MNAANKLLDEARKKTQLPSDNQLAIAMGITRGAISHYRQGTAKPDNYVMAKLAEITGRDFEEIVAMIEAEREPNKDKKEFWKDFLERIGGSAAALSCLLIGASKAGTALTLYIMSNRGTPYSRRPFVA